MKSGNSSPSTRVKIAHSLIINKKEEGMDGRSARTQTFVSDRDEVFMERLTETGALDMTKRKKEEKEGCNVGT